MAITEADSASKLAVIRRLEAVGFRAFPATHTVFDGTWAVRLTPAFPAKRLNSVNPLDPSDHARIAERVQAAERCFAEAGRSLVLYTSGVMLAGLPPLPAGLARARRFSRRRRLSGV